MENEKQFSGILKVVTATGQGAQSADMTEPWRTNASAIPYLDHYGNITGKDPYENFSDEDLMNGQLMQPANILIGVMSVMAIKEAGLNINIALGHSIGEITAAYAAGAIGAKEAITLGHHRGIETTSVLHNVSERFKVKTGMFPLVLRDRNVHLPGGLWEHISKVTKETMQDFREKHGLKRSESEITDENEYAGEHFLERANENTDEQGIVAGTMAAIEHLRENLPEIFRKARPLAVDGAFHSIALSSGKKIYAPYVHAAGILDPSEARLISPTTISELKTASAIEAMLIDQLTLPVRYKETLSDLVCRKIIAEYPVKAVVFLETGPAPLKYRSDKRTGILTDINRKNVGSHIVVPGNTEPVPAYFSRVSAPI